MAPDYVWPLSTSTTPDEMNTSFRPRINRNRWDFHDGIDLPGERGITTVHALRDGVVRRVGPKDDRFSSRHVIVEVEDPTDGPIFLVYLHLDSTDPTLAPGVHVSSGTAVTNEASAAPTGSREMRCADPSTTEDTPQRAGIELDLTPGRFEWVAEGRFNPLSLGLAPARSVQLLRFQAGQNLLVAARIRHRNGRNLGRDPGS